MERRHDRFRRGLDRVTQVRQVRLLRWHAEFGDIGAGNEGPPGANDKHGLRGVLLRRRDRIVDTLPNGMRQGIDGGVIDGDYADIIDEFVSDGRSHCGPFAW